ARRFRRSQGSGSRARPSSPAGSERVSLQPSCPLIKAVGNIPSGAGSAKSEFKSKAIWRQGDDVVVFRRIICCWLSATCKFGRRSALRQKLPVASTLLGESRNDPSALKSFA